MSNNSMAANLEGILARYPQMLTDAERQYPEEKRNQLLRLRVAAALKKNSSQQQQQQQQRAPPPPVVQPISQNVPATPRQSPRVAMQQVLQAQVPGPAQQMDGQQVWCIRLL